MRTDPDFLLFTLSGAILIAFVVYRLGRRLRDSLGVHEMPQSSVVQTTLFVALTGGFVGMCGILAAAWNVIAPDRQAGWDDTFAVISVSSFILLTIDIAGKYWLHRRRRSQTGRGRIPGR